MVIGMKQEPVLPAAVEEEQTLLRELRDVRRQLEAVDSLFNLTCDNDMIDYYIHQVNALDARYRFLYKKIKERRQFQGLTAETERVLEPLG